MTVVPRKKKKKKKKNSLRSMTCLAADKRRAAQSLRSIMSQRDAPLSSPVGH